MRRLLGSQGLSLRNVRGMRCVFRVARCMSARIRLLPITCAVHSEPRSLCTPKPAVLVHATSQCNPGLQNRISAVVTQLHMDWYW